MDKCDVVRGWKDTDLRTRIDDFVARGFQPILAQSSTPHPRQTLVHGDFGKCEFQPESQRETTK